MIFGFVYIIKRTGEDGNAYILTDSRTCLIGRSVDCDIRVQLEVVSKLQCRIDVDENGKVS